MVRQGDIIKLDFNPQRGHEQAGYRPAVVVSNDDFNTLANMIILCPITNRDNGFPQHVPLDERTVTTGFVQCEQVRTVDLESRRYKLIERIPADILAEIIDALISQIELLFS